VLAKGLVLPAIGTSLKCEQQGLSGCGNPGLDVYIKTLGVHNIVHTQKSEPLRSRQQVSRSGSRPPLCV
jgi:hypothetical protein